LGTKFLIYCVGEEEKAQDIQQRNVTPHRLSREGGYHLLEKKIMDKKLQKLRKALGSDEVISPPSPPSRHEKWKLARTKPGGQMTSTKAYEIAQRIVS